MSVNFIPRLCLSKMTSTKLKDYTKLDNFMHRVRHLTFSCIRVGKAQGHDRRALSVNSISQNLTCRNIASRWRSFTRTTTACQKFTSQDLHNHASQKASSPSQSELRTLKGAEKRQVLDKRIGFGTKGFKENIVTIPNILTLTRMASAPVIGCLVLNGGFPWALGLFVCAGITDVLDGVIARNVKNQTSVLGTVLDPLADKILVITLYLTLTAAHLIPVPLTALIVCRDIGLIGASFYIRYISLPPPKTLSRYFDFTHATAELYPSLISKVNTVLQLSLVALSLAAPVFDFINHPCLQALWFATAATTFASGLGYVLNTKSSVKILTGLQQK